MHTRRGGSPATSLAAVTMGLVLSLSVTGCGGGGSTSTGLSPTLGSTASDPSPSTSPTNSAGTVLPARGITFKLPRVSMSAPRGWKRSETMAPWQMGAAHALSLLTIMDPGGNEMVGLDELARVSIASVPKSQRLHRQPDVIIDGIDMYHLAGTYGDYRIRDEYGVAYLGSVVTILIDLDNALSPQKRDRIRESVLASVNWH
jgi:hypothetical protein